jgi:hypothetical protein
MTKQHRWGGGVIGRNRDAEPKEECDKEFKLQKREFQKDSTPFIFSVTRL